MFALSAFLPLALFAAAGTGLVSAHPHHPRSAKEVEFQNVSRRSLSTCDNTMRKRALNSRAIERRALYAERAKLDRGLAKKDKRDLSEALSASVSLLCLLAPSLAAHWTMLTLNLLARI